MNISEIEKEFEEKFGGDNCPNIKQFLRSVLCRVAEEAIQACKLEEKNTDFSRKQDVLIEASKEAGYNSAIAESQNKGRQFLEDLGK